MVYRDCVNVDTACICCNSAVSILMNVKEFHSTPFFQSLLEPLIDLVVKTEAGLLMEVGSPLRKPLLSFLTRHPDAALNIFLQDLRAMDRHWNRMLVDCNIFHGFRVGIHRIFTA